jgi:hypothetical protein
LGIVDGEYCVGEIVSSVAKAGSAFFAPFALLAGLVSACGDDSPPIPTDEELASALLQPSDVPPDLEENRNPEFADRISLCMPTGDDPVASAGVEYQSAEGGFVVGHGIYAYEDDAAEEAFDQIVDALHGCADTSELTIPELGDDGEGLEVTGRESGVPMLEGVVLRDNTVQIVATVQLTADEMVGLLELADERLAGVLENTD